MITNDEFLAFLNESVASINDIAADIDKRFEQVVNNPIIRVRPLCRTSLRTPRTTRKRTTPSQPSVNNNRNTQRSTSHSRDNGDDDFFESGNCDITDGTVVATKYTKDLQNDEKQRSKQRTLLQEAAIETYNARKQLAISHATARQGVLQAEIDKWHKRICANTATVPQRQEQTDTFVVQYVGIEFTFALRVPALLPGSVHPMDFGCFPAQTVWGVKLNKGKPVWLDINLIQHFIDLEQSNKVKQKSGSAAKYSLHNKLIGNVNICHQIGWCMKVIQVLSLLIANKLCYTLAPYSLV